MPSTSTEKTKQELSAEVIHVAIEGAAAETATGEVTIKEGMRVRGSHPAVKARPDLFVRDGASDEEVADRKRELYAFLETPAEHTPLFTPRRLPDEEAMVAARSGDGFAAGDRLPKSSPTVKRNKADFVPVIPSGVTRERAVVARTTVGDGRGRIVPVGCWLDREDEVVQRNPSLFTLPIIEEGEAA